MAQTVNNPVTKYLAIVSIGTLCLVGISTFFEWDELLSTVATPLTLLCALLVAAYTLWALKLGEISCVGHCGEILHYERKKEPISFYFLAVLYLVISVPVSLYMMSLLFSSFLTVSS